MRESKAVAPMLGPETIGKILDAGARAPSGDNVQPWRVEVQDDSILVFLMAKGNENSFYDLGGFGSVLGCGALIENICVAAGSCGFEAKVTHLPDLNNDTLLAEISLLPGSQHSALLYDAIWKRLTNRTRFNGQTIPEAELHLLTESLDNNDEFALRIISGRSEIREIAALVYHAEIVRSESRDAHELLMDMIRFSPQEALSTQDGFPLKNLEVGAHGELFLRLSQSWKVMKLLNRLGASRLIGLTGQQGIRQASGIGAISFRPNRVGPIGEEGVRGLRAQHIRGGQAFERVWLTASSLGLDLQPMAILPILKLHWDAEADSSFSPKHQNRLRKVWPAYDRLLGLDESTSVLMLFRVGYGKEVKVKTLRKPLAQV